MVLKCADIGHLAAAPALHQRWAYQLEEEFFRQGDQEKALGLPVSPLMDRNLRGGMTKSQVTPPHPTSACQHAVLCSHTCYTHKILMCSTRAAAQAISTLDRKIMQATRLAYFSFCSCLYAACLTACLPCNAPCKAHKVLRQRLNSVLRRVIL